MNHNIKNIQKVNLQLGDMIFQANSYIETDPSGSVAKCRGALELILKEINPDFNGPLFEKISNVKAPENSWVIGCMHHIRKVGNKGVHESGITVDVAQHTVSMIVSVAQWHLGKDVIVNKSANKKKLIPIIAGIVAVILTFYQLYFSEGKEDSVVLSEAKREVVPNITTNTSLSKHLNVNDEWYKKEVTTNIKGTLEKRAFIRNNTITPAQVSLHNGKEAKVCGYVAQVSSFPNRVHLNFITPFPDTIFSGLIWLSKNKSINLEPEQFDKYSGINVCITGEISEYNSRYSIIIDNLSQIEIAEDNA